MWRVSTTNACTTVEERRFQRRVKLHTIQAGFSPQQPLCRRRLTGRSTSTGKGTAQPCRKASQNDLPSLSYFWQLSLTMVNSVTVRWPCSFASLSMPCSFISDFVSSFIACISRWATAPVTFTVCPTCSSSLTVSLLSSQVAPPFMVRLYSLASSPFCRQPVSVLVFLCVGLVVSCAANPTTVASMINAMNPVAIFLFILFSSEATVKNLQHTRTDDRGLCKLVHTVLLVVASHASRRRHAEQERGKR